MRTLLFILLAATLGVSSAVLAACGNRNGLLPQSNANALKHSVDEVGAAVSRKDCARATTALQQAQDRADKLPASVNPRLRRAIDDGLSQLVQDVEAECTKTTPTQTTQTDTVPTQTTTTPTNTTPTQTEPPNTGTTDTGTTTTDQTQSTPDQTGGTPPGQAKKQSKKAQG
ncbi:MAG: hypothetical protein QOD76_374 [Solirubrobacteraceae bacterium]|jgi:hypothetical protein|nr:hypothetical protein [Solirubrobacteraceae bacterium]